jgi:prephenate dehydrogenase
MVRHAGRSLRICLIGGDGGMGRLFNRLLTERGHTILVLEKGDDLATHPAISESEVVIVAVPMAVACDVVRVIAPRVSATALLCDVNSLKRDICAEMQAASGQVMGLHPMFGPSVQSFHGQKVVVCEVSPGPLAAEFVSELAALGAEIVESDPETHDRMMAVVQVLVHFSTIVMGEALKRTGTEIQDSLRFTSPIYRLELAVVGRIFTQNADLYGEILMSNPYGEDMRSAYVEAARDIAKLVEQGDRGRFVEEFEAISEWFRDFGPEAMSLSDYIIQALVAR